MVVFDQLYSFDRDTLLQAIPRPEGIAELGSSGTAAAELFDRILQLADNAGATDEHRALNYLAVRYPAIYARAAEAHGDAVVRSPRSRCVPRGLSGTRRIVDVVFSYTNRKTDVPEQILRGWT